MADDKNTDAMSANDKADETDSDEEIPAGASDALKLTLKKERDARKEAQRDAKAKADELATLKAEKTAAAEAKAKADEADAAERGQFKELAEQRKTALDAATANEKALAERVKSYEDRDRKRIDDGIKDGLIDESFLDFDPGADADLTARMSWFEKSLAKSAERTNNVTRFPATPREQKGGKPVVTSLVSATSA